ncbi:hypothetical protein [Vibrio diabolicus]|uniref:hypothetical protein n=1 Tax=Vibrio diabolicus TaxID=50719 RepID=UPI002160F30D|nr:hypothetical protein [Vibrio diabolicus]MCS0320534.1 hypothetical protein [Vibrio diabolicus]
MSIKSIQKKLLADLGEKLSVFGFNMKPKKQSYYRPTNNGWDCVHISFIDHDSDFDVTLDIAIRFNDVENLVNSNNEMLTSKEKSETSTLGVEIGNLSMNERLRWKVSSQEQLPTVIDSILKEYKTSGEEYFSKYSSLESVHKLLSSDEKIVWKHCPFHATRAKKAIAIAYLLGQSDIKDQINHKKQFLEDIKDFGLPSFLSFIEVLEQ